MSVSLQEIELQFGSCDWLCDSTPQILFEKVYLESLINLRCPRATSPAYFNLIIAERYKKETSDFLTMKSASNAVPYGADGTLTSIYRTRPMATF